MDKFFLIVSIFLATSASAKDLKVGDQAPIFSAQKQDGSLFSLDSRKGSWTVLYFYPKAETPGCTKQACAYRDNLKKLTNLGAAVFGVSSDSIEEQAKFHKNHQLNFDLLADPEKKIIRQYGTKMPVVNYSKRWTFLLDPNLKIVKIDRDVDPVFDSEKMAKEIESFKRVGSEQSRP